MKVRTPVQRLWQGTHDLSKNPNPLEATSAQTAHEDLEWLMEVTPLVAKGLIRDNRDAAELTLEPEIYQFKRGLEMLLVTIRTYPDLTWKILHEP